MELAALILSLVACGGLALAALLLRSFIPAYAAEKAKNLASKEDLAQLTSIVEGVKATHLADIERLKSNLSGEAQVTERRRRVYEEMCGALRIFVEGHVKSDDAKNGFHSAYATAWLWASDEVLAELNRFIALQQQHAANPECIPQQQLKASYTEAVLAMRRDVGFQNTEIQGAGYQFVQFT